MEIYHGSQEIVQYPLIRKTKFTKDFRGDFIARTTIRRQSDGLKGTAVMVS